MIRRFLQTATASALGLSLCLHSCVTVRGEFGYREFSAGLTFGFAEKEPPLPRHPSAGPPGKNPVLPPPP